VAEFLNKHSVDVLLTNKTFKGKGPSYVFSNAAIEVVVTEEETVKKALEGIGIILEDLETKRL